MATLAARAVVTPEGILSPAVVETDGELIASVGPTTGPVPDRMIAPGYIDLQVNGHDDVDVSAAEGGDWDRLDDLLLAQGVTTWCPTLVTSPLESYRPRLEQIAAAAARGGRRPHIAGAHLEGPFLGGLPGAHDRRFLAPLDLDWIDQLPPVVRVVTVAPELERSPAAIRALAERGVVVSLGHSTATYEETLAAADSGARLVTHLFNAMSPVHHRQPGMVGAALTDHRLTPTLIADLVHVHPAVIAVAFRARGGAGVALVTDAVAWRSGRVGSSGISRVDEDAPRRPDGTIAGSALTMDRAVRNVVSAAGVPFEAAVAAASTVPARVLGDRTRGEVAPGRRADLVVLDSEMRVGQTWVGGEPAWEG
ncbi:MAG TPA: amidohydrolase family protein [Acidimicrobiales bacterium]|nr:amidohydrolase family protein [Acidimicrobiales bacterium]